MEEFVNHLEQFLDSMKDCITTKEEFIQSLDSLISYVADYKRQLNDALDYSLESMIDWCDAHDFPCCYADGWFYYQTTNMTVQIDKFGLMRFFAHDYFDKFGDIE